MYMKNLQLSLIANNSLVSSPVISSLGSSDHYCISVRKYSRDLRPNPKTTKKRLYKNFDSTAFCDEISKADFSDVLNCEDPSTAADLLCSKFASITDKYAPVKIIQNRRHYVPYITQDLKNLMDQRDQL